MIKHLGIEGVFLFKGQSKKDKRGENRVLLTQDATFVESIVEVAMTKSKAGVLRGFHTQKWDKFVYPLEGEVDVYLMEDKKLVKLSINDKNRFAIHIPAGVAHLYIAKTDVTYLYFHNEPYSDKGTKTISYKKAGIKGKYIMSKKDRQCK